MNKLFLAAVLSVFCLLSSAQNGTSANSTFEGHFIAPTRGYKDCFSGVHRYDTVFVFYVQSQVLKERHQVDIDLSSDVDTAIQILNDLIASYKVDKSIQIQGYTLVGAKGRAYHVALTGPLSSVSANNRYWFSIRNIKQAIKTLQKVKNGTFFKAKVLYRMEHNELPERHSR